MELLQQGTLFAGRYNLVQEKGRGSFGEVWLARDTRLDIDVALKVYIALDDRGVEEFKEEFKKAYNLNHPNLLHASYFDTDGHRPYLVMPYCPSTATELIGKCDEKLLWKFIADVSSGLSYLHKMDVVHHDIKPDNILRTEAGNFVITDFGISTNMRSTLRRNSVRDTKSDTLGGALPYMGPEMFSGQPESIKATDIWALGATLFELATGELPFFGQGGVMLQRGAAVPVVKGDYSDDLKQVICDCLALQTWDRPQAAALYGYALAKTMGADAKPSWRHTENVESKAEDPAPTRLMFGKEPVTEPQKPDPDAMLRQTQAMEATLRPGSEPIAPVAPLAPPVQAPVASRPVKKPAPASGKFNIVVIIWLALAILGSLYLIVDCVLDLFDMYPDDNRFLLVLPGAVGVFMAVGFTMMLRKSKAGFMIIAITPLLAMGYMYYILNAYSALSMDVNIGLLFWLVIHMLFVVSTFCITLIRKDGVSAWKLMSFKHLGGWQQWLAGAVIIAGMFLIPNVRKQKADSAYTEYEALCSKVESLVKEGSNSNYKPLIQAIEEIKGIKEYDDEFWYDERYDHYDALAKKVKDKSLSVAKQWEKAAEAQRKAGNTSYAAGLEADIAKLKKASDL